MIEHVGADLGMHVILSSHLLEEVERVSNSVVILEAGRVVADGVVTELAHTDPSFSSSSTVSTDPIRRGSVSP